MSGESETGDSGRRGSGSAPEASAEVSSAQPKDAPADAIDASALNADPVSSSEPWFALPSAGAPRDLAGMALRGACALLALAVLIVFGRSLFYGFVDWDDLRFIVTNPLVVGDDISALDRLLTPTMGYLAPVTIGLQALAWRVGAGAAWPFHLLNLMAHGACVALVVAVARKLGSRWDLSLALASVFALHPLVAEPVAWATGLKDLLAIGLSLAATWLFLSGRFRWAVGVVVLAALSKPVGATVGVGWLVFVGWRWAVRRESSRDPRWMSVVATAVIASVLGVLVLALGALQHNALLVEAPPDTTGWVFQPPMALGYYVHHAVLPWDLHPMYAVDRTAGLGDVHTLLGIGALLAMAVAAFLWRRSPAALALMLAATAYAPISNLAPFPRFLADSYAYGPLAWLCVGGAVLLSSWASRPSRVLPLRAGLVAAVVALAVLSAGQVGRWSGNAALWGPATAQKSTWAQPWLLLAQGLAAEGDAAGAAHAYAQFHARTDSTQYLASFAQLQAGAGQLASAECLMVHDVVHGERRDRALHNLALFAVSHPEHKLRRTGAARSALAWASSAAGAGRLRWPEALQARLPARTRALGAGPEDSPQLCTELGVEPAAYSATTTRQ